MSLILCTKNTNYAVEPWLGVGQEFTVVDTPGFGDSDQEDSALIDEMMAVLKNTVKSASVLFLVLDGGSDRFERIFLPIFIRALRTSDSIFILSIKDIYLL